MCETVMFESFLSEKAVNDDFVAEIMNPRVKDSAIKRARSKHPTGYGEQHLRDAQRFYDEWDKSLHKRSFVLNHDKAINAGIEEYFDAKEDVCSEDQELDLLYADEALWYYSNY